MHFKNRLTFPQGISNLLAKLRSRNSANGDRESSHGLAIPHPQSKEPALDGSSLFADQKTNTVLANNDSSNLLSRSLCRLSELRGTAGNATAFPRSTGRSLQPPLVKEARMQSAKSLLLKPKQQYFLLPAHKETVILRILTILSGFSGSTSFELL